MSGSSIGFGEEIRILDECKTSSSVRLIDQSVTMYVLRMCGIYGFDLQRKL